MAVMIEQKITYTFKEFDNIGANEEFVIYVYAALLGRIADKSGYIVNLQRLNEGILSRGDIIIELLASEEGKVSGITVSGLWLGKYPTIRKIIRRLIARIPLVRYMRVGQ
jgi:hypothetical protein